MKPISLTGKRKRNAAGRLFVAGKGGFTLVEILLTVVILGFGISRIFTIFFESASAVRHIKNRLYADLAVDDQVWRMKRFLDTNIVASSHNEQRVVEGMPGGEMYSVLTRVQGFYDLYRLDVEAVWRDGRRDARVNRVLYIRGG